MLTLALIRNIRAFIERTQLTGREVPAYNEIIAMLEAEEQRLTMPPPSPPE